MEVKYRTFPSMNAAAGALGVSQDTLKLAKEAGCAAFRASRVYEKELLDWMSKNPLPPTNGETQSLRDQKISEEIRKLLIKHDRDAGKLIAKVEIAAAIRRALGSVSSIIESKIVGEWPSAVAGLDPAQARVYGRRLYDEVMAQCKALEREFPE